MLANEILFEEKKMSLKDVGEWFQTYDHGGMFKRGKKGLIKPQVIAVQQFLSDNGFKYKVKNKAGKIVTGLPKPDGWYGAKTASAVKAFQKKEGLKPDGDVGRNTLKAMINFGSDGLVSTPASAELQGDNADLKGPDYIEELYKQWAANPDGRDEIFSSKPNWSKDLKRAVKLLLQKMQNDPMSEVDALGINGVITQKNIDLWVKNAKRRLQNPDNVRPREKQSLLKGFMEAIKHARISPAKITIVNDFITKAGLKQLGNIGNKLTGNQTTDLEDVKHQLEHPATSDEEKKKILADLKLPPQQMKEFLASLAPGVVDTLGTFINGLTSVGNMLGSTLSNLGKSGREARAKNDVWAKQNHGMSFVKLINKAQNDLRHLNNMGHRILDQYSLRDLRFIQPQFIRLFKEVEKAYEFFEKINPNDIMSDQDYKMINYWLKEIKLFSPTFNSIMQKISASGDKDIPISRTTKGRVVDKPDVPRNFLNPGIVLGQPDVPKK